METTMQKYRLVIQIEDGNEDNKFIISSESRDDDEAIRIAHVAADVLLFHKNKKFSISIINNKDRAVAVIYEGQKEDDFIDRPIEYCPDYIASTPSL
jgi:hypothetical protein